MPKFIYRNTYTTDVSFTKIWPQSVTEKIIVRSSQHLFMIVQQLRKSGRKLMRTVNLEDKHIYTTREIDSIYAMLDD